MLTIEIIDRERCPCGYSVTNIIKYFISTDRVDRVEKLKVLDILQDVDIEKFNTFIIS